MNLNYPIQEGWTVYAKSDCVYCDKVKDLLHQLNEVLNIIDCDDVLKPRYVKLQFLEHMKKLIGSEYKTFPMVFKDNQFIGGFNEVEKFLNENSAYKYRGKTINIEKDF